MEQIDTRGVPETREPYRRSAHSEEYGMSLPLGKTCGDCLHLGRCEAIYGRISADETCDWSPSRFKDRTAYWTEFADRLHERDLVVLRSAIGAGGFENA